MKTLHALALLVIGLPTGRVLAAPVHSSAPSACTAARAQDTTIEAVQADYRTWSGRCVRLSGMLVSKRLYADRAAIIDEAILHRDVLKRSIVVYRGYTEPEPMRPAEVDIVGVMGSCEDDDRAMEAEASKDPGSLYMMTGMCHYTSANYLRPVAVRRTAAEALVRFTDADVAPDRRPMVEAPAENAHVLRHREAARAMLASLAKDDEPGFRSATKPWLAGEITEPGRGPPPAEVAEDIRSSHAEFVKLKPLRERLRSVLPLEGLQEKLFMSRIDVPGPGEEATLDAVSLMTRWCTDRDCTGRWPVLSMDGDNDPARPYVCAATDDYFIDDRMGVWVHVDLSRFGFVEPN